MFRCGLRLAFNGKGLDRLTRQESSDISKYVRNFSAMTDKFRLPERYGTGEKSVWVEYIQLVHEIKPKLNLGQGFPDYASTPEHVTKALAEVTTTKPLLNQYTRGFGHPRLVENLAKLYSPLVGVEINPMTEVLVSPGAYGALYSAILGHVDVGDEVIVIEPFFDCYLPMIKVAGGKAVCIPLKPKVSGVVASSNNWILDMAELAKLFNSKTKMIILNTPHNPIGKVFTEVELKGIAELCIKHNVLCLSDEVYEWLVYEPQKHFRIASLPGMWERTITIGSAGKTFSVTGWKTGWAYGPAKLMENLFVVHQSCVYTHNTTVQEAIAIGLEHEFKILNSPECYFNSLPKELIEKRDFFIKVLVDAGFTPTIPEGGYFVVADTQKVAEHLKEKMKNEKDRFKDYRFTKALAREVGIMAIPPSAFYSDENKCLGEDYARFCFFKKDENLKLSKEIFEDWIKNRSK